MSYSFGAAGAPSEILEQLAMARDSAIGQVTGELGDDQRDASQASIDFVAKLIDEGFLADVAHVSVSLSGHGRRKVRPGLSAAPSCNVSISTSDTA